MSAALAPAIAPRAELAHVRTLNGGCACGLMPLGSTRAEHAAHLAEASRRPCAGCADPVNHPHAFDCEQAGN